MYGTASKLGKMLMYIKWIVLAKANNFLLSRPVALYMELKFSLVKCFISKQTFQLLYSSLRQCNDRTNRQ